MAEPTEIPFGMKTSVGPRNHELCGGLSHYMLPYVMIFQLFFTLLMLLPKRHAVLAMALCPVCHKFVKMAEPILLVISIEAISDLSCTVLEGYLGISKYKGIPSRTLSQTLGLYKILQLHFDHQ